METEKLHAIDCLIFTARLAPVPFERHALCTQSAQMLKTRMTELDELKKEVERLRAVCNSQGIDPSDLDEKEDALHAVPSDP